MCICKRLFVPLLFSYYGQTPATLFYMKALPDTFWMGQKKKPTCGYFLALSQAFISTSLFKFLFIGNKPACLYKGDISLCVPHWRGFTLFWEIAKLEKTFPKEGNFLVCIVSPALQADALYYSHLIYLLGLFQHSNPPET